MARVGFEVYRMEKHIVRSLLSGRGWPCTVVVMLLAVMSGCATTGEPALGVSPGMAYVYETNTGERLDVTYYTLTDDSLDFVRVVLPDGQKYTLPQTVSASGARYSDGMYLVWWNKGDTALVEVRGKDGEWTSLYEECTVVSPKS